MPVANLGDYAWLISEAAAPFLGCVQPGIAPLVSLTESLRTQLGPTRTHLVLEQIELRRRALQKFAHAERMFFTARLLEQATDEQIAVYKASRFPDHAVVADLCCGIGGDLAAIAERGPCVGVDRDPIATALAAANCRALGIQGVRLETVEAGHFDVAGCDAWHIDPDRRPGRRRTTQLDYCDPDISVLRRLVAACRDGAIKLAPATVAPGEWSQAGELDWVGSRRECRQQVVWLGALARRRGLHTATVVKDRSRVASFSGRPNVKWPVAASVDRFVFEPHSAVLAAQLTGALADRFGLASIAPNAVYLTGGAHVDSPLLAAFKVTDVLPFDRKRLRAALRSRRIGRLEVKTRGIRADPEILCRQLRVTGDQAATLLIARTPVRTLAILAQRLES